MPVICCEYDEGNLGTAESERALGNGSVRTEVARDPWRKGGSVGSGPRLESLVDGDLDRDRVGDLPRFDGIRDRTQLLGDGRAVLEVGLGGLSGDQGRVGLHVRL